MHIVLVTDAWQPQVNGVVRTYENTARQLSELGHQITVIGPPDFYTIPCPTYRSIRLAVRPGPGLSRRLESLKPDAIHVATEGPLGHVARRYCLRRGLPFTTAFHTQFPEYIRMRIPIPLSWTYDYLRRFHGSARRTLVPTESQRQRLLGRGFRNVVLWSRGVDTDIFRPADNNEKPVLRQARPIFAYMGRVAAEKNIEAFLKLNLPGSKLVVGDGPDLAKLRRRYPEANFTGYKFGRELGRYLAAADVCVFPSLTDTYGLVMLEAMACGVPVAAFPVTGPIDVVQHGVTGVLSKDLRQAALAALDIDPGGCVEFARAHSWRHCAESFAASLDPIGHYPN